MTAAEPTPLDRMAEALYDRVVNVAAAGGASVGLLARQFAEVAAEALLAGDWLERVLGEHRIESTGRGEVTCRGCRERGWMSGTAFRAHQAAAIRAAGVGL